MKRKFTFLIAAAVMLLTMMATTGTMWGQEATLSFTSNSWGLPEGSNAGIQGPASYISGNDTITLYASTKFYYNTSDKYLLFGKTNSTLTLPKFSFDVEKIEVVGRNGASGSVKQNIYVGNNAVSTETTGATGTNTYMISSNYQTAGNVYVLKVTSNHNTQVTSIKIYKKQETSVATPTFSPEGGTYTEAQTVTISCDTQNVDIYYTTDGSTPDDESTQYNGSITVSESMTIKAIAYDSDDNASSVATAVYTIQQPLSTMDEIFAAATAAGNTATTVIINFDNWVVTGVKNKNAYVTDGTKGFIIYQDGHGFSVGDVLSGTATCKVQLYNGSSEITTLTATTTGLTVTSGGAVTPATNISIADLTGVNTGAVLSYDNLTYNGTALVDANDNTITPYNTLYSYTFVNGKSYNVKGIYLQYNSTKELLPRSADDIEVVDTEVADPVFSPVAGTYATTQTVTMSCTTEGAAIHYTTDGTEPDGNSNVYSTGITVSETTTFKAKAIKGDDTSAVITATYHICSAENPYTVAQALAFLEYPTSTIWVHGIVSTAPTSAPNSDGQLTYYISDNGETTNQLQVYKGKGLNNAAFTAQDDIQVGDIVTITGTVKIYNTITEFDAGNYLTSFERPEVPAITADDVDLPYNATSGVIEYTISNYVDGTITASTQADWISAFTYDQADEIGEVGFTTTVNNGSVRQTTVTLTFTYNTNETVTKDVIVTQASYPVPSITVNPTSVNATAAETEGTLTVTYTNITTVAAEVYFCDANGDAATYDWLDAEINNDNNVYYTIDANTGAARTAYLKVYALDDNAQDVYSELVTINQVAGTTPPTPGQYNWVATDLADLTANDVFVIVGDNGDTYAMSNDNGTSAPTAKAVTIENGAITETVADNIQWNLSTSDDGYMFYPNGTTETWLYCTNTNNGVKVGTGDAKHFTLSDNGYITTSETTDQRYIGIYNSQDWRCYTSEGGNIANQTFAFYKRVPASTEPSITLNQYTYNLNADGGQAELPVVYNNMPANPQAVVIFYESDGVTPLTENPTWITATINGNNNVNGNIQANTGEARSAYFKVKGIDADNHDVYSDLVTINQAAYVLSIVFETTELNIEVGGEQNRVLSFEYQGFGQNPAFEVRQYDATGQTQTTYEWLTTTITQVHKVNITVAANTGAARSGYFKVYGSDGTVNTESNLVTINQAEYVAPTYTVTYNANGGTGTMTDPNSPYTANTEVTLLDNTFTAPEGKIWDSWLVKDANQTTIAVNNNTFTMPASNVTVTAQWVDNPVVPTYEWVLTALEDLTSSDIFVIVGNNGNNYAMANDKGASAPTATAVTIANNKLSDAPANNLKWNISGNATDGYTFYPNGSTTTWLYCIDNNNGLKVGNSSNNTFVIKDNYLYNQGQERYIGIYNSSDWRSYTTINNNIASQTFGFYKRQEATTDPQLYTNDVNIESDATAGEITYTLENEVTGGVLTAAITEGNEGNWLNLGTVGATVPFTCSANTEATARTATVTLTYTYNAKATVTATAVVTQAALIIDYATLPFEYDGNGTGELPTGLTPTGLGTYNASPKMKFDGTGDNLILKLNQAPVSLSYDIKGNSFSGGTFTVQTSANGTNYDDLATYTTLGDAVQSITHVDLNADVRYIKWIYTNKDKGNVALGNIHATEYYDTYGDVTLNDLNLTATSESLIVHSGSVVTVEGELVNNSPDNLVIEDGGQLVFDGDGVMATMKKKTVGESKAEHWYTIASPVNNIDFANITNLINAATFDLYRYDEATYTWENYKNTAHTDFVTAENGRGYLYYNSDGNELSFAGKLNNSASYDLTASGAQMNGLNLIGNPFTQDITLANISLSDDAQISEGFYVLSNNSDWVASVNTVKPCEGFIVKVNKATTATFSKSTGSSKSRANRDYIAFTVANNQYEDVAYAMFSNGLGLDKIDHRNAEIPMVYIPQNGQDYAIATMSDDTEMFNLNFKAMTTGQYTLSVDTKGNYSYLHVYDKMTNEDVNMLLEGEYSFIGSPRDAEDRFVVRLSYRATIDGNDTNIFAYQSGSDIIVSGNGELQVFDVMGRMVATMHVNGVQTMSTSSLQTGLYIFRLNEKTQKIVVR